MRYSVFIAVVGLMMSVSPLHAADTEPSAPAPGPLTDARAALDKSDYPAAEGLLKAVVQNEPKNADAWNLLGYAIRKQGRMDEAEGHYGKALALDDEHKGALEYLGMLYVQTGRIDEAKVMLARLDDACLFGCDEYDQLKKAVTTLKAY